jgi:hypothetical protein
MKLVELQAPNTQVIGKSEETIFYLKKFTSSDSTDESWIHIKFELPSGHNIIERLTVLAVDAV